MSSDSRRKRKQAGKDHSSDHSQRGTKGALARSSDGAQGSHKKSKKNKSSKRRNDADHPLFVLDDTPTVGTAAEVQELNVPLQTTLPAVSDSTSFAVTVPEHVHLSTKEEEANDTADPLALSLLPDSAPLTVEDLASIHYLDVDSQQVSTANRYFHAAVTSIPDTKCNVCKASGHVAKDCKALVCATCGAIDQHRTRECIVGLICFTCGQRGHRSRECPNPKLRHLNKNSSQRHSGLCDRCGSNWHPSNNCPSIWRRYRYISEADFKAFYDKVTGDTSQSSHWLEQWCYNCAASDHFGDDCQIPRGHPCKLDSASAFSNEVSTTGPFYDLIRTIDYNPRHLRFKEPTNQPKSVGRQTVDRRRQHQERSYQAAQNARAEESEEDWYPNSSNLGNHSRPSKSPHSRPSRSTRQEARDRAYPVSRRQPSPEPRHNPYHSQYAGSDDEDFARLQGRPPTGPAAQRSGGTRDHRDQSYRSASASHATFQPAPSAHGYRSAQRGKASRDHSPQRAFDQSRPTRSAPSGPNLMSRISIPMPRNSQGRQDRRDDVVDRHGTNAGRDRFRDDNNGRNNLGRQRYHGSYM